jgi:quinol monooxygenase YgiN
MSGSLSGQRQGASGTFRARQRNPALIRSPGRRSLGRPQGGGLVHVIHVIAIITAKPGMREAVLREFRGNMPAVLAEEGCIEYGPAIDAEGIGSFQTAFGPDTFVVIEKWESPAALKAHAAAPQMQAYGARTREMIASRVIHVLSPAA